MTSAAPEKAGPVSEQAVVEPAPVSSTPTTAPLAPVPLPVMASGGPVEASPPTRGGSGLERLRAGPRFAGVPQTLAELLQCNDADIDELVPQDSPTGALMRVLKGAFEADWFRAKSCSVAGLRGHAISLGSFVRSMAARKGPAAAAPARDAAPMEITPKQLKLADTAVKDAMAVARQLAKDAAGPTAD